MAETKSVNQFIKIVKEPANKQVAENKHICRPDAVHLDAILTQRHKQRKMLFNFSLWLTGIGIVMLFVILLTQGYIRIFVTGKETFKLFEGYELEILSVSLIGQFLGVISIITKSLWDDSAYKELLKG